MPLEGPRHSGEKHIDGRFACPVAGGYPEAMRLSLASTLPNVRILTPFVDLEFPESVVRAVTSAWPALSPKKVRQAVDAAHAALEDYRAALRQAGEALWRRHETSGEPLIVLYHLDPLINHGLPALIESMGAEVVTEDAVGAPRIGTKRRRGRQSMDLPLPALPCSSARAGEPDPQSSCSS